jgi:peptide deformylase
MAILEIRQIGDPVLRQRAIKITHFDQALSNLADDMVETMHEASGVGLAAPQIGVSRQIIVVEMPQDDDYPHPGERWVLCNPEIVKANRETEVGQEGCLSVAGYIGMVERPTEVLIRGQDIRGRKVRLKAEGYIARVFQHEIDHLHGTLYVDKAVEGSVMTIEQYEEQVAQQQTKEDDVQEPAAV